LKKLIYLTSMWALLITAALAACSDLYDADNPRLATDCNNVGYCLTERCFCCDTSVPKEDDLCRHATADYAPGTWEAIDDCQKPIVFIKYEIYLLVPEGNVECLEDGSASSPHYADFVESYFSSNGYNGEIVPLVCKICSSSDPCSFDDINTVYGTQISWGTDLNTYYDMDCRKDTLPEMSRSCPGNPDFGAEAYLTVNTILDKDNDYAAFTSWMADKILWGDNFATVVGDDILSSTGDNFQINLTTLDPTGLPSSSPTFTPSFAPSHPAVIDTSICEEYVNDVSEVLFLGGGASCRAHINESWPGGRTCESPYIVCLPEENTPALDIMGNRYKNNTHRYTIQECKQECSYDQRCLGIEFRADDNSTSGGCLLLGSIQLQIEDENSEVIPPSTLESSTTLDRSSTGVDALCFSKQNSCNPFFEAEDLTDEMLECYCPNNRKGYYTKKVKRSVNNTRFCDNDTIVDERIRKAQANRMFHLCENWCLFGPHHPEQENWYWDPWKQCWRETYAATNMHRGYCDRVIRNPDSIELQYVNHRSASFCDASKPPTSSPVPDVNTTWYLSDILESCDEVCGRNGKVCAAEQTTRRFETEEELIAAFNEAGFDCTGESVRIIMESTRFVGWALPGLRASIVCANRQATLDHLMDLDSDCGRKIGFGWQRLCACY